MSFNLASQCGFVAWKSTFDSSCRTVGVELLSERRVLLLELLQVLRQTMNRGAQSFLLPLWAFTLCSTTAHRKTEGGKTIFHLHNIRRIGATNGNVQSQPWNIIYLDVVTALCDVLKSKVELEAETNQMIYQLTFSLQLREESSASGSERQDTLKGSFSLSLYKSAVFQSDRMIHWFHSRIALYPSKPWWPLDKREVNVPALRRYHFMGQHFTWHSNVWGI